MNRTVPMPILRGALALSVVALALAATEARASTAANTRITNQATVTYNDAGNNPQTPVTASATVTVTLVPSAVTLSSPANTSIAQGTSATLAYTITATANGPDTYNLSSAAVPNNLSSVTPTFPAGATLVLGGTTLAADAVAGATSITVPYDGVAGATVNGIGAGSVIVVGGNAYTVQGVTKDATANTATIALSTPGGIAGATVLAGQIVGERKTFNLTVPSGNVTSGGSGTQTVTTTATGATAPNPATSQATPTVVTVNRPTLTVTKEVSTDGTSFAATVNAAPGTSLYYRITVTNTGATPASAVTFADAIPAYLTYAAGTARFATSAGAAYTAGTALTDAADADGYTFSAPNVSYVPGGQLAGGAVLVLFYRATIN